MIGPEGTGDRVTAWLDARLPARLDVLEARLELAPNTLPNPALVVGHEIGPLGVEDWPAVIVTPGELLALDPVDLDRDGAETYLGRYSLEVLAWVRAEDYSSTDRLRRRYVLAIREALLERKQLAARPGYGQHVPDAGTFTVAPASIREDYGPVIVDDASRTIAGVRLTVTVNVVEELEAPTPMGTVDTVTATTRAQPRDQAAAAVVVHPGLM